MIALLTIAVLLIGLIAIALSTITSTQVRVAQFDKAVKENQRVGAVVLSIQSSLKPFGLGRELLAPYGEQVDGIDHLLPPSSLPVSEKNTYQKYYVYCPFSMNKAGGTDVIPAGNGEHYLGELIVGSDGLTYVYSVSSSADPTGTDLIAAIISPLPTQTSPSCGDLRFDEENKNYYVQNYDGIVYPVQRGSLVVSGQSMSSVVDDVNDDIAQEFSSWDSVLPDMTRVVVKEGASDYVSSSIILENRDLGKDKTVMIEGSGENTTYINGSNSTFEFNNITIILKDLTIKDGVTLNFINSDVVLDNVNLSNVTFKNSRVDVRSDIVLKSGVEPVLVQGSEIYGEGNVQIIKQGAVGMSVQLSEISIDSLWLTNNASGGAGVVIESGAKLNLSSQFIVDGDYLDAGVGNALGGHFMMQNGLVYFDADVDAGIFTQGDMGLSGVTIGFGKTAQKAVVLGTGGELIMNDVSIAAIDNKPVVGIYDAGGAKFIGGYNTQIHAGTACWSGDIFTGADDGLNGNSSVANDESSKPSNRSVWFCNL